MPKTSNLVPQVQPVFTPGSQRTALVVIEQISKQLLDQTVKMDKALSRLSASDAKPLRSLSRRGQEQMATLIEELHKALHTERANLLTESRKAPRTNMHWVDLIGIITSPYQKRLAAEK